MELFKWTYSRSLEKQIFTSAVACVFDQRRHVCVFHQNSGMHPPSYHMFLV